MHPLVVIPVIALLAACVVASAIVARDPGNRARRLGAALAAAAGFTAALEVAWQSSSSALLATWAMRLSGVVLLTVGPLCLELACESWSRLERPLRLVRVLAAGTAAGLALLVVETGRFVSRPIATDWGFVMNGGDLMWLTTLHTIACLGVIGWMLRAGFPGERVESAALRRNVVAAGTVLVAALAVDLALALQAVAAPRLAALALLFTCALFWRPSRDSADSFHPGAFDVEILDSLSDGVAVLRDDGRVRSVNASLEALAGVPRGELVDRDLAELLGDPLRDASTASKFETTLRVPGETPVPVAVAALPLRDRQDSVIGCAVSIRDRREVVDLQRHLVTSARFAAVGELAAGLAHEVNNPLAFIQANLNQMQRDFAEFRRRLEAERGEVSVLDRGGELIGECLEGIARVASIVRDVRGFAHGGEEVDRMCDVNALVEAAARMAIPDEQPRLVRRYAELPAIVCREQELKQLFLGMALHAAHARRKATQIVLHTETLGNAVRVSVEDDGIAYTDDALDRIFEPILDEDDPSSHGLALSIAYHIACQLGGEIEVTSDAGANRVAVVLPCNADPSDGAASAGEATA